LVPVLVAAVARAIAHGVYEAESLGDSKSYRESVR
jgi:hypothetical protein